MCLILFSIDQHPTYQLILAANRDEFFDRPTATAEFWIDNKEILGGRDIQSGGTWLGMNTNGRFIAITNFRDPNNINPNAKSRGEISHNFLSNNKGVSDFLIAVSKNRNQYNGFNLLLTEDGFNTMHHYSNVTDRSTKIDSGIHGISNHLLDTPWPKIEYGKKELNRLIGTKSINTNDLVEMLKNDSEARDDSLPNTGISYELEKKLSPVFISMNGYGTRCSTALLLDRNNKLSFHEVTYDEKRQKVCEKKYNLDIKS